MSKELSKKIYLATENFPKQEVYSLCSQLRRASLSISANLAEGTSRLTYKDKAHFTMIAYSSALEVVNHVIISHELMYISREDYTTLRKQISEITSRLNALHKAQVKMIGETKKVDRSG